MKMHKQIDEFKNSYSKFGYSDTESLLKAIGIGIITSREMFRKIYPQEDIVSEKNEGRESRRFFNFSRNQNKGIILDGIDN